VAAARRPTWERRGDLPAAIDLDTANRALTLGRSTGYALAKRGQYPVKVLRLGNSYRVVTAELLRLLGLAEETVVQFHGAVQADRAGYAGQATETS